MVYFVRLVYISLHLSCYSTMYIQFIFCHTMNGQTLLYGLSGGLAGITVDLIYYPLETIKTRIMGSNLKENLLKEAGKISKFKGFSCQMIVSFPYAYTFFYLYGWLRQSLRKSSWSDMLAASIAESVANIIRNPLELIKQRLMVGRETKIS
jgi:solute carrier family 25 S-adenosylmethionine transporter 26